MSRPHSGKFDPAPVRPGAVRRRPFTLLELTLSLLILAVLVAMLFMTSRSIADSWERMTAEKNRFSELLALDRTLDSILSNTVPFEWRDEDNVSQLVFLGQPDRMGVVYQHRVSDRHSGGLRFVHLSVQDDKLVALHQTRPLLDVDAPGDNARSSVLAEGVDRIECWYGDMDERGRIQWLDSWETDESRKVPPMALRLDVFWLDGRHESWLRRTSGHSQFERYGRWIPPR